MIYAVGSAGEVIGGAGSDTMNGGSGADTFLFNAGFGSNTIVNATSNDVIEFGSGIDADDLTFSVVQGGTSASSVVISGAGGSVTVQGGVASGANTEIVFGDGTSEILQQAIAPSGRQTIAGANGNLIISTNNADSVVGGDGQDTISASGSNDSGLELESPSAS